MTVSRITPGIFITMLIFSLSSCEKEGDKSDLLLSGVWRKAFTDRHPEANPAGKVLYAAVDSCEKDDSYLFTSVGKLIIQPGEVKCYAGQQNAEIAFTRSSDQDSISIGGTTYRYLGIRDNQMKYAAPMAPVSGYDWIVFLFENTAP